MKFFICLYLLITVSLKAQNYFKLPELKFDDKAAHFYVAMGSSIVVGEVLYQCTNLEGLSSAVGAAFGISTTLAKEYIYDRYYKRGVFSIEDILVGCFGAVTGGMIHRVIIDLRYKHNQKQVIKLRNAKELML